MKALRTVMPYQFPYSWESVKPPISYYGGKQLMWTEIKKLVPEHGVRKEPFVGGATSLILPPANVEIWNDKNEFIVNFYTAAKLYPDEFENSIRDCITSEYQYNQAKEIYQNFNRIPSAKEEIVQAARAMFILANLSFRGIINRDMSVSFKERKKTSLISKKNRIKEFCKRIENAFIFCRDAVDILNCGDHPDTWSYVDPPYVDTCQGHYDGYSGDDFENLLFALENHMGLFLLSCNPSKIIQEYVGRNAWNYKECKKIHCASTKQKKEMRTEVLVWNYNIHDPQKKLF